MVAEDERNKTLLQRTKQHCRSNRVTTNANNTCYARFYQTYHCETMIVVLHVLYLFGKYLYENINRRRMDTERAMNLIQKADEKLQHVDEHVIKFFPPLYVQRYVAVREILCNEKYAGKIRKVIDFGCAELGFAIHLKNTDSIEEIYLVDIDRSTLENFHPKIAPLISDYINSRARPLSVHVCEGSVTHNDEKLANADAVVCIELIEHLYPDTLEAFPYNIFGFIKPLVAIVTTPNADFNVLFKDFCGSRHHDHKFEWTREQFQDWASNITLQYPDYEVTFDGVGAGPSGTEHLGSCSQLAIFHRKSLSDEEQTKGVAGLLKTVAFYEYPQHTDNRSDEEKILDTAVYYIQLYSSRDEDLSEEIPLAKLTYVVDKYQISMEGLRTILEEANWAILDRPDGPVILIPSRSTFSMGSVLDYEDFLENDHQTNLDPDWETLEPGPAHSYSFADSTDQGVEICEEPEEEENWDSDVYVHYDDDPDIDSQTPYGQAATQWHGQDPQHQLSATFNNDHFENEEEVENPVFIPSDGVQNPNLTISEANAEARLHNRETAQPQPSTNINNSLNDQRYQQGLQNPGTHISVPAEDNSSSITSNTPTSVVSSENCGIRP